MTFSQYPKASPPVDEDQQWEPEGGATPDLAEIKLRIEQISADLKNRGKKLSGRTIIACHTLPYTCSLVAADEQQAASNDQGASVGTPPVELRQSSTNHAVALHQETVTKAAEDRKPALPIPAHLQAHSLPASTSSPKSILITNPFEERVDLPRNASFLNALSHQKALSDRQKKARWFLTPRLGHAALNAGIRELAADGNVTLVAWPGDMRRGMPAEDYEEDSGDVKHDELTDELKRDLQEGLSAIGGEGKGPRCRAVWLPDKTSKLFYDGYCKTFLWPTFHYFTLNDTIDRDTEAKAWEAYQKANESYAQAILDVYTPGDIIWIHDYHLTLVPRILRTHIPDAAIGFFLHSPFPSSEMFRCLPRREAILDGLLGADLCCFQTWSYGRHFISSAIRVMGYETSSRGHVDHKGSVTQVVHCPIGIDSNRIELDRTKPGVQPNINALRELYKGKKILVGRDKLDPTKGILANLQAYERLLEDYPQWQGNTVLILVTSPSPTDSPQLAAKVSELVDHINAVYGSLHFQPVHHYHQRVDREEYFALLSVADLALVTSIRDGMNTTSMEYVLCQKENKNPLIISEYCGIATSMRSAIRINPWDLSDVARAIDHALNMPEDEKAARHEELHQRVTTHTAAVWINDLVLKLLESLMHEEATQHTPQLSREQFVTRYKETKKRLLCFDYDGTLTPIVKVPSAATPSPELLNALEALCADPNNIVYVISGRNCQFLDQHLGHIKNMGFSAEHGCFLKAPGETEWKDLTQGLDMSWRADVEDVFRYYSVRTTGSFVEKKDKAITFHHRNADPTWGEFQAKECQAILESMQERLDIDVMVGKRNLEVRPARTTKGEVVKRLAAETKGVDFIVCAGDDKTDEDMFRSFRQLKTAITDSSSPGPSYGGVSDHGRMRNNGPEDFLDYTGPLKPEDVYTIVIDTNPHRKTLASWALEEPADLISVLGSLTQA